MKTKETMETQQQPDNERVSKTEHGGKDANHRREHGLWFHWKFKAGETKEYACGVWLCVFVCAHVHVLQSTTWIALGPLPVSTSITQDNQSIW